MKAKNYHTLGQEASSNPWNLFYIRCENLKQSIKLTILIMVKSNWMFITERVIWGQNPNFQSRNWYEWQKIDTLWVKNPAQIQETYSCKKQKTETVCQIKHSQMSKCLPLEGYFWAKIQMFMPRNWIGIFQGSIYMPSSRTKLTISIEKKTSEIESCSNMVNLTHRSRFLLPPKTRFMDLSWVQPFKCGGFCLSYQLL